MFTAMLKDHPNGAITNLGGENFDIFFMAPSSEELEPPRSPGRFTLAHARASSGARCRPMTRDNASLMSGWRESAWGGNPKRLCTRG